MSESASRLQLASEQGQPEEKRKIRGERERLYFKRKFKLPTKKKESNFGKETFCFEDHRKRLKQIRKNLDT